MAKKNFVSYGDAEVLMTEISSKMKDQNTQYIDSVGRNKTSRSALMNVQYPYNSAVKAEIDRPINSTQLFNVQTSNANVGSRINTSYPAVLINAKLENQNAGVEVHSSSSIVSAKVNYTNKAIIEQGSGSFIHGHAINGDIVASYGSYAGGDGVSATGYFSHAEGKFTTASAPHSHVEGEYSTAKGRESHVEGRHNEEIFRKQWHETGVPISNHIEGYKNRFTYNQATYGSDAQRYEFENGGVHVEGKSTNVYVSLDNVNISGSHVEGHQSSIENMPGSHAEGFLSNVKLVPSTDTNPGILSEYEQSTNDYGLRVKFRGYSHAEGVETQNYGHGSHTEGVRTRIRHSATSGSHVEGIRSSAGGYGTHAEGCDTYARDRGAHAEGTNTNALGRGSHAEGNGTYSSYVGSHSEGEWTVSNGPGSHAGGLGVVTDTAAHLVTASGFASFAHGYVKSDSYSNGVLTVAGHGAFGAGVAEPASNSDVGRLAASALGSIALGVNVQSNARGNCALGRYNSHSTSESTHILTVGNGSASGRSNAFRVAANGTYGAGAYNASGADYAEMFEWADANVNNEDRRGLFVTINGDKISIADGSMIESLDDILGIVSADPSVCGDVHDDQWKDMYLRDIFGAPIFEEYEEKVWTGKKDEEGDKIYETVTQTRLKVNPDYDMSLKYVPRSERPEWSAVGMLGKLVMVSDGTAAPGDYVTPDQKGRATYSSVKTRFYCMERLDNSHIRVLIR